MATAKKFNISNNMTDNFSALSLLDDAKEDNGEAEAVSVSLDRLVPFDNHPFKVDTESEDYAQLVESIKEQGLLEPLLVRPTGDGNFQIISGHRRAKACRDAGLDRAEVLVKNMDDDTATIAMVHANFHRSVISISEKAKAYRMWYDAEKHQGKRGDTAQDIGDENGESKTTVKYYVALSYLIDGLLDMIDAGTLGMKGGYKLYQMDEGSQKCIYKIASDHNRPISVEVATALRKLYDDGDRLPLTAESVYSVFLENSDSKPTKGNRLVLRKDIDAYFEPNTSDEDITSTIMRLLEG